MSEPTDDDKSRRIAANIKTIRRGVGARVDEIKRDLAQWLAKITTAADTSPATLALVETAFDRHLAVHDEAAAAELIESVFRRAVQRHRGTLQ
jgi:hypothetical protein